MFNDVAGKALESDMRHSRESQRILWVAPAAGVWVTRRVVGGGWIQVALGKS